MRLVGALVPVAGVFRVAFPTVEVGMTPSRFLAGNVVLGDIMGSIVIPPSIPPESLEQVRKARRGYWFAQRSTEFFDRHSPFYARLLNRQTNAPWQLRGRSIKHCHSQARVV
jgi:hypothetical protein